MREKLIVKMSSTLQFHSLEFLENSSLRLPSSVSAQGRHLSPRAHLPRGGRRGDERCVEPHRNLFRGREPGEHFCFWLLKIALKFKISSEELMSGTFCLHSFLLKNLHPIDLSFRKQSLDTALDDIDVPCRLSTQQILRFIPDPIMIPFLFFPSRVARTAACAYGTPGRTVSWPSSAHGMPVAT